MVASLQDAMERILHLRVVSKAMVQTLSTKEENNGSEMTVLLRTYCIEQLLIREVMLLRNLTAKQKLSPLAISGYSSIPFYFCMKQLPFYLFAGVLS